jgi:hypothetical protein
MKSNLSPLDSLMENYLKRGYMITPNRSRFKDNGWNGTHAPKNPRDSYYRTIEESWTGYDMESVESYIRFDQQHSWRGDARVFSWFTPFMIYTFSIRLFILKKMRSFLRVKP